MSLQDRKEKIEAKIVLLGEKIRRREQEEVRRSARGALPDRLASHLKMIFGKLKEELANKQADLIAIDIQISEDRTEKIARANKIVKVKQDKEKIVHLLGKIEYFKKLIDEVRAEINALQGK